MIPNNSSKPNKNPQEKFNEVHAKNIQAAKKLVENYVSSSEEDEDVELDEKSILKSVYQHYDTGKENAHLLSKTSGILENILNSGAATCLICIGSIKRTDQIWTCNYCYCLFHLNCIKRWANDSMAQYKLQNQTPAEGYYNHLGEYVHPKKVALHWCCPQCREEFKPEDRPSNYECFCRKEINPVSQPWLIPHSCGEICGKSLQPNCGHKCTLLCHPGPCPPCAQYASVKCKCGKSPEKSVRCIEKLWECQRKCGILLECNHVCSKLCHKPGECPSCPEKSMQPCECGNETQNRECSKLKWHCKKMCGKMYSCEIHTCRQVCHSGKCGECPLSQPRFCPCGKTKKIGPCTEDKFQTCGDTCQKILDCGLHSCTQRCHKGKCPLCLIRTKKKCRCGLHEKELPCSKDFNCETKCKQIRDCGKHPCNRKCCDKNCSPCDKVCSKPLSCGKHKCQSICHKGPCYPCRQQSKINCSCGKTSKNVPCGRERSARILCLEKCRIPSKCHHTNKHRCHKNECPPCVQPCNLPNTTSQCGHICLSRCHAAVRVTKKSNSTSIWEPTKQSEIKSLPHPRCEEIVAVTCIGGHELADWPCYNSKSTSCQRQCNRLLRCGNHKCKLICHSVPDIKDMNEQSGCAACEEGCTMARAKGCIHRCPRPCHLPPCQPCSAAIKTKCHCGLIQVMYKCSEYYNNELTEDAILESQENLKSCRNRCLKNFPCGHRCSSKCHSGPCPYPESCRKKMRVYCECKRLRSEISCDKHRAGLTKLDCNENCAEILRQHAEAKQKEEELTLKQDYERNLREVEQFERKFKRKPKERKTLVEENKKEIDWKMISVYMGILGALLIAIALALYEDH